MDLSRGNSRGRNIREELAEIIRADTIAPAAIARECRIETAMLLRWLNGGRLDADYASRVAHFLDDRITVFRLCKEIGNALRGNAVANHLSKVKVLIAELRETDGRPSRDELCDQILMRLGDVEKIVHLMSKEPTVRESISPGDRLVIVKSGKKAVGE